MQSGCDQSKKLRNDGNMKDLTITDLPEGVIREILSHLPTKEVVRTSVLSKSLEHKWTHIFRIEVDNHIDPDFCLSQVSR